MVTGLTKEISLTHTEKVLRHLNLYIACLLIQLRSGHKH
ncbi:phosphotyrosine protein phosphatase [Serratia plymuthica A30]|nr:phosphotyrosine protein phosphatase [Serratia plymuthica A30]